MNKPRIIIVTPFFSPVRCGIASYFSSLIDELKDQVDFTVLTTKQKDVTSRENKDGFQLLRVVPNLIKANVVVRLAVLPICTFYQLKILWFKRKPQAIHVHSSSAMTLGASLFSLFFRVPLIMEVQDMMTPGWLLKLGKVKYYIATGQAVSDRLVSLAINPAKILKIYSLPPRQIEKVRIEKKESTTISCLFVGEINEKVKGLDLLLKGFSKAFATNQHLILNLVGEGQDLNSLKNLAKQLGVSKQVNWLGSLSRFATLTEIAQCDMLLLPSRSEGMPRVILEAFYFSKPVIASRVGGVGEVVKDKQTGLLIDQDDSYQLANKMVQLASDGDLANRLGQQAKSWLNSLPSWSETAAQIKKIYLS
ncbi:glycosyltransferase family 4 protein [Patescibacteria group bacterium]|nr:glycosyltransferase family 4 protein [Patescibacteria group bacterium]